MNRFGFWCKAFNIFKGLLVIVVPTPHSIGVDSIAGLKESPHFVTCFDLFLCAVAGKRLARARDSGTRTNNNDKRPTQFCDATS